MTQMLQRLGGLLLGTGLLLLGAFPAGADDDFRLPEIGDPSGGVMTRVQEQRLGQAFMRNVRKQLNVITDPWMSDYIQSLGGRLASNSSAQGQRFHFFLIDSPVVNAFAGPDGHIGVFAGLLLTTETESELASVIAHEIAHVTQKHLVRAFDDASRLSLPMGALALAAAVIGGQSQLGAAAMAGVQAGMVQHQINFTRANEHEADRMGIHTLARADFNPRAMPVFFERMGRATRFYGTELPEFLRTHPVTTNRIADSRGRAETYPYRQHPDSLGYHLVRATLRERQYEDPKDAVRFFRETLADGRYRNEAGQRYGYALALLRNRDYKGARAELDKLLQDQPQQTAYRILDARLYRESGKPERALATLEAALKLSPDSYPLTMAYAQTLLDTGNPRPARQALEKLLPRRPLDAALYELLSQAAGDAGEINQAHEYLAEHYFLSGRLEQARQQLEIALRDKNISLFRGERMSARLKQIQGEIAELKRQRNR